MRPAAGNLRRKFYFLFFISVLFLANDLCAQLIIIDEPPVQRYYNLTTPRITKFKDWRDMRDVLHYDKYLLGRGRIMGNISYNTGRVLLEGENHAVRSETRQAIAYYTRIRFLEEFSVNSTFYKDYNPRAAAPWVADYTYAVGRYNWKNHKLNFGYENNIQNQYTDNFRDFGAKFMQGYYFLSLNEFLGDSAAKKIMLDKNSTSVRFIFFARYAIKYSDENFNIKGGLFTGKPTLGAGFHYTIGWNIYIESAAYYYFNRTLYQQAWDPDYTYGFGYFNYRSFRVSLTYGNWAINRFPWNKPSYSIYQTTYHLYGLQDGNFRIALNWMW
jgi:hypothetical protein